MKRKLPQKRDRANHLQGCATGALSRGCADTSSWSWSDVATHFFFFSFFSIFHFLLRARKPQRSAGAPAPRLEKDVPRPQRGSQVKSSTGFCQNDAMVAESPGDLEPAPPGPWALPSLVTALVAAYLLPSRATYNRRGRRLLHDSHDNRSDTLSDDRIERSPLEDLYGLGAAGLHFEWCADVSAMTSQRNI